MLLLLRPGGLLLQGLLLLLLGLLLRLPWQRRRQRRLLLLPRLASGLLASAVPCGSAADCRGLPPVALTSMLLLGPDGASSSMPIPVSTAARRASVIVVCSSQI
jgi:hypothetical protein